jgi:metal-responsive CopG/Arc/MetJ family transcriptional regulator
MARFTVTLPETTLHALHARASQQGTTASALVRDYVEAYTRTDATRSLAGHVLMSLSIKPLDADVVEPEPPRLRVVR